MSYYTFFFIQIKAHKGKFITLLPYVDTTFMPLQTTTFPDLSAVTILEPLGLYVIIVILSLCTFPSSLAILFSSFHIVIVPKTLISVKIIL